MYLFVMILFLMTSEKPHLLALVDGYHPLAGQCRSVDGGPVLAASGGRTEDGGSKKPVGLTFSPSQSKAIKMVSAGL